MVALSVLLLCLLPAVIGKPVQPTVPRTVVLSGDRLVATKRDVQKAMGNNGQGQGRPVLRDAMRNLVTQADAWLPQGPWTVTAKTMAVPNGTINDYASQAPYWWAKNWQNPTVGDKCPYIQRDGVRNPEVDNYTDRRDGAAMMTSVYQLALAWWYTDDDKYRAHAADILRTWFITPKTRMTPNLLHAQIVPCKNSGRAIGIIDFSQQYTDVVDAAAILATKLDGVWGQADDDAFKSWNRDFLTWLTTSPFGIEELQAKNNHGTFAAMQIAALAAYLGQNALAAQTLRDQQPRIDIYIAPNGSQPLEIVRTTSYHYTTFTLVAYTRMVDIGANSAVGVDLWNYVGPQGQSIKQAIEYLVPYAAAEQAWPWPELHLNRYAAWDIVNFAADKGMTSAQQALGKLEVPPGGNLWQLRPAVEQLDSILLTS